MSNLNKQSINFSFLSQRYGVINEMIIKNVATVVNFDSLQHFYSFLHHFYAGVVDIMPCSRVICHNNLCSTWQNMMVQRILRGMRPLICLMMSR